MLLVKFKNNNSVVFARYTVGLFLFAITFSCSSVPYQEMSDARQIIVSVSQEIEEIGLNDSGSIATIMQKSKGQLAKAKQLLNEKKYNKAKKYAINASKLAKLAKTEIQQQIK
jgi:hypothetical protein